MSKVIQMFDAAMRDERARATATDVLQKFKAHSYNTIPLTITITEPDLMELLGQMVGAASVCWHPRPKGVFDSKTAQYIVDAAFRALTKR
jgi:hypothetical protein